MNKNKHLTLDERYEIYHSLEKRMSFKAIGALIGKDCTTISKEIKGHIIFEKKVAPYRPFNDCLCRLHCSHNQSACASCSNKHHHKCSTCGKCTAECADYQKEVCPLLSKPPYVCNGCPHRRSCTLENIFMMLTRLTWSIFQCGANPDQVSISQKKNLVS